nr:VTT domain-containing protein [Streptomyces termitum]
MLDDMGSLRSLAAGPWIYPVVATSILLDVFLPVLPSGFLVISAATAASAAIGAVGTAPSDVPSLLALLLTAASASLLGDFLAYRLALRGGHRLDRAIARSRRLTLARERLGTALARGGGLLVILARFAPAGRSVVSLGAGAARRPPEQFLPWSALAAVIWASYSVGLGWLGGRWLGATWFSAAVSTLALLLAGGLAGYLLRRPGPSPAPAS